MFKKNRDNGNLPFWYMSSLFSLFLFVFLQFYWSLSAIRWSVTDEETTKALIQNL